MHINLNDHVFAKQLIEAIYLKRKQGCWVAFLELSPDDTSDPKVAFDAGFLNGIVQTVRLLADNLTTTPLDHVSQSNN